MAMAERGHHIAYITAPNTSREFYYSKSEEQICRIESSNIISTYENSLKMLDGYSTDVDGKYKDDFHSLREIRKDFYPSEKQGYHIKMNIDLNKKMGDTDLFAITDRDTFLQFLKWIVDTYGNDKDNYDDEDDVDDIASTYTADIITIGNVFSQICRAPYSFFSEIQLFASMHNGKIYIMNDKTTKQEELSVTTTVLSHYGHKFQDVVSKGRNPLKKTTVNDHFRGVVQAQIGQHQILFSTKYDVIDDALFDADELDPNAFIQTKMSKVDPQKELPKSFIRYKLMDYYMGCLIRGNDKTLMGYRSEDGFLTDLIVVTKRDLIRMSQGKWNPETCFQFASDMFDLLKKELKEGDVFRLFKAEKSNHIHLEKLPNKNMYDFIPKWFTL